MGEFQVRFTEKAKSDLNRLYDFLLEFDIRTAERSLQAIEDGLGFLRQSPFSCRKAVDGAHGPLLRELIIPFGASGYLALFEIENAHTVTILAMRHQREDDFH
ncbi:type II toxin-antitoxin system RelE/ParE family toxin [Limnohabitans sp. Jir72]|uniref:type II toxin-antitoxin system RelE/ParE family toxin n=1 Tax=Limnohabitans sp. Jir72 TaxID=1977909 RepID=UPI000D35FB44|nr:type II toxin-antitoxin system RelE/ParE family toxin [Limnohabitans sp. Jir72]PUE33292.1 plasmid stabilization protein [Limnohabitans sp. Jir72]